MKNKAAGDVQNYLDIAISSQQLTIYENGNRVRCYPVSTAKKGAGELMGSQCTPRGWHKIRAKIGAGQPLQSVFRGRRPTNEIYNAELGRQYPQRDWILTRILWLGGLEPGKNRYGTVDSTWRYIYIHGCPDELMNGNPASHGCIRMKNADVLDLFNRVEAGITVYIHD
ncbi:L,D-transpeptidase-like protein [Candidatus Methylobacter favarea]|uniref:L,D-transpeptidase-like protein n=1 Tax=Candidatus Methylobacter favarea TaxID=2707345 RepID=A0A8S0YAY4_9GAMM|nr:L,D-transpeptidase [Candidatus Methylobacter favarea]CAA9892767.1 L,D-transpeptidase-like protein [Candidatus Methylobacter favarea]